MHIFRWGVHESGDFVQGGFAGNRRPRNHWYSHGRVGLHGKLIVLISNHGRKIGKIGLTVGWIFIHAHLHSCRQNKRLSIENQPHPVIGNGVDVGYHIGFLSITDHVGLVYHCACTRDVMGTLNPTTATFGWYTLTYRIHRRHGTRSCCCATTTTTTTTIIIIRR